MEQKRPVSISDSTDLEIIDAALCGDAAHKMP